MNNHLHGIEGIEFTFFATEEGSLSLSSTNGWVIAIYNAFEFISPLCEKQALQSGTMKAVSTVECSENSIDINFTDGSLLRIDLSPSAYSGPEALQLVDPSGQITVWN